MSGEWTDGAICLLRQYWAEGHSTAEIGRRIGISKNAVVGKAHRLDLPGRPSPIRSGGAISPAPAQPRAPRLAEMMPLSRDRPETAASADAPGTAPALPAKLPTARLVPAIRCEPAITSNQPCCWPVGEPGRAGFHFCGAFALVGKPYCDDHAQLAYKPKPPREPPIPKATFQLSFVRPVAEEVAEMLPPFWLGGTRPGHYDVERLAGDD
jgi:GcrA cell cycle regulator